MVREWQDCVIQTKYTLESRSILQRMRSHLKNVLTHDQKKQKKRKIKYKIKWKWRVTSDNDGDDSKRHRTSAPHHWIFTFFLLCDVVRSSPPLYTLPSFQMYAWFCRAQSMLLCKTVRSTFKSRSGAKKECKFYSWNWTATKSGENNMWICTYRFSTEKFRIS